MFHLPSHTEIGKFPQKLNSPVGPKKKKDAYLISIA